MPLVSKSVSLKLVEYYIQHETGKVKFAHQKEHRHSSERPTFINSIYHHLPKQDSALLLISLLSIYHCF